MQKMPLSVGFLVLLLSLGIAPAPAVAAEIWPQGLERVRQKAATPLPLTGQGGAEADIVLLDRSELLQNAAQWIVDFARNTADASVPVGGRELLTPGRGHIVALVGDAVWRPPACCTSNRASGRKDLSSSGSAIRRRASCWSAGRRRRWGAAMD
jgi:hypothetical protein